MPPSSSPAGLGQSRSARRRLLRRRAARTYTGAGALLLVFALVWGLRLVMQDLPPLGDPAQLRALNRPADVTFVARDGQVIGTRPGPGLEPTDLSTLPPYLADAFRASVGAKGDIVLASRLVAMVRPGDGALYKLQSALLSRRLIRKMSGDPLLAFYLDRADFGAGTFGLTAAARVYFDKRPAQLSLAEAAFLAARSNGPMLDATEAAMRTESVLQQMFGAGRITREAMGLALAAPIMLAESRGEPPETAEALDWAAIRVRGLAPGPGPLRAVLNLDPVAQSAAIAALRMSEAPDATVAALGPGGRVTALATSHDHRFESTERLVKARPLGDAAAFVYRAAGLQSGKSPATLQAMSLDALLQDVGPVAVTVLARRMVLPQYDPELPPYGDPMGLAAALAALRDGGKRTAPHLIAEIADPRGKIVWRAPQNDTAEVYETSRSRQMTAMMTSPAQSEQLGRPVAAIGGAAQDGEDGWFAGFSAEVATAVWSRPGAHAQPIWTVFMEAANRGRPVRALVPDGTAAGPKADFYGGLAADFDQLSREADRP